MVALAPHLVRPLPLVVPAFDGARPDRLIGVGLNLYDVMSVDKLRRPPRRDDGDGDVVEPERHRSSRGEEVVELLPALAGARADLGLPVLRLPDRRRAARAHRARRGRALRRGAGEPACEATERARGGRRVAACATTLTGDDVRGARPTTSSTRPACGPTGCAPRSCTTRPSCRRSGPSRGTHVLVDHADAAAARAGRSCRPARGARSSRCRGSGATLIGTTDTDHDETDLDHVQPAEAADVAYLLDAVNAFFGTALGTGDVAGRLRGRAAADRDRPTRASPSTSRAAPSCSRPPAG